TMKRVSRTSAAKCFARSSDRLNRQGSEETKMSRIGNKPVAVPQGVTATIEGQTITAKGPKGELQFVLNDEVLVKLDEGQITIEPRDQSKAARSKWGMTRTQVANILTGVKDGFERKLEINGVGY